MPFFAPSLSRMLVHDPLVTSRPFDVIRTTDLVEYKHKQQQQQRQYEFLLSYVKKK